MTSPDGAASPDLEPYLDLTLVDVDPQDLVDLALSDIERKSEGQVSAFPEGSYEAMLIEAVALEDAETVFAINRLATSMFVRLVAVLYDLPYDVGAVANVGLRFAVSDLGGRLIPAGTRVSLPLPAGDVITFTVDAAIAIAPGVAVGNGTGTAEQAGLAGNGFAVGQVAELLSPLSFVDAVTVTVASSAGRDAETLQAYLTRGKQKVAAQSVVLVQPRQFELFALGEPGVFRARAINDFNPASGNAPGLDGGHIFLAVLSPTGQLLTAAAKAALDVSLTDRAAANLAVHVGDSTITAVNVTATLRAEPGEDVGLVLAAAEAALRQFLNVLTWQWGAVVRRNDIIAVLEGVAGVDFVLAGHPTTPAGDVALPGVAPLAAAGVITLTVQVAQ